MPYYQVTMRHLDTVERSDASGTTTVLAKDEDDAKTKGKAILMSALDAGEEYGEPEVELVG